MRVVFMNFLLGGRVVSVGSNEGMCGLIIAESVYFYTFEASDAAWRRLASLDASIG